jgi:Copper binding proteins, plastocyanin/azurin family
MTRRGITLVIGVAVAALIVGGCGGDDDEAAPSGETTSPTETSEGAISLTGNVGPGFEITLIDSAGQDVSSLPAGQHVIAVTDKSDIHNFHLTGPGVDEATDVAGQGEAMFDVVLEEGTYSFVCDPHAGSMSGSFEVSG